MDDPQGQREELLLAIRRAIIEAKVAADAITARLSDGSSRADYDYTAEPVDEDDHPVRHLVAALHDLAVTAIARMSDGLAQVVPPGDGEFPPEPGEPGGTYPPSGTGPS